MKQMITGIKNDFRQKKNLPARMPTKVISTVAPIMSEDAYIGLHKRDSQSICTHTKATARIYRYFVLRTHA